MSLINIILSVVIVVLAASVILVLYRFIKGPTLPDRVTAIDLITTIVIAIIVVFSIIWKSPNFFDVAMVLSLISFLGSVSFAFYLTKRNK
ncbi:MAG: monovalent cation/H+ antiporter complex subunit F [Dysgonamonadaceae bacterium]|nr:monovalent cation/H+ antiporter complex subunit F [Dysgonamonadaceae bacterium]MDD4729820.1 monovalent cation/H+ antiporter complex subunit F [Dysgonamonadaceae bacterium]